MNKEKVQLSIADNFTKRVQKDRKIHNAYLLVHSEKLDIHLNLAEGTTGSMPANTQQPYFIASIGKLFTSVLIGILVEKGMISYEDTITQFLDNDLLHNLHIYKEKDYTNEIKIRHLLNHTSGLHDYFDDKPKQGKPMIDMIFDEPSRFWTPQETIQWSKEHLKSHFPPGKGFHYSDTGYHVLGLIIEKITSRPFHEALQHYIFQPLEMNHSYLAHYSEPMEKCDYPVADLYGRDINITQYRSLSIDYAGGGIVATSEDLLKFMKALVTHEIIKEDTFEKMKDWAKFSIGIDYGYGLMNFRTIPFLMPKKYNVWGNAGIIGSFMFYHPVMDIYLIGNLNQFTYHRKGIRLMFKIIDILSKCDCS
ncbi:MAG: serine hydrolase [ANME-2 cluster archaeon]|nr:serine hydrolase [ANME-2 cluster archaeon]MBC2706126.1 serine hydrolase [ANME-2 cluster archaeon]MBC2747215.1 serine hydrolase [ANME-2 cluster archaeon]